MEALFGRRSRRFALGDEIPDGHWPTGRARTAPADRPRADAGAERHGRDDELALRHHPPCPLRPPPVELRRRSGGAHVSIGGRFHTTELFFTDDSGVYFFPTRDAGALVDPATEEVTPELMMERHRGRVRQLSEGRLYLPAEEPYMEGHNTWCVNVHPAPQAHGPGA